MIINNITINKTIMNNNGSYYYLSSDEFLEKETYYYLRKMRRIGFDSSKKSNLFSFFSFLSS